VLLTVCTVARLLQLCASTAAEVLNAVRILILYLLFMRVHKTFAKAVDSLVMSVHLYVSIPYGTAILNFSFAFNFIVQIYTKVYPRIPFMVKLLAPEFGT
jgi:hypothetical protein